MRSLSEFMTRLLGRLFEEVRCGDLLKIEKTTLACMEDTPTPAPPPPPAVSTSTTGVSANDSETITALQIANLKLKKANNTQQTQTPPLHEDAKPSNPNDHLSQEEKERIIEKHFEVNMDRWAHLLPPTATIPVFSLPLRVTHARAILDQSKEWDTATFKEESANVLNDLRGELEKVIRQAGTEAVFVKLSSRSPKDVLPTPSQLEDLYKECIGEQKEGETDHDCKNSR